MGCPFALYSYAEKLDLAPLRDLAGAQNWDLHPDGKRFVYMTPARAPETSGGPAAVRYFVLQGWFGELRRLTAPKGK